MLPLDPTDLLAPLRTRFGSIFGRPPTVVARAPGRVNLIGEHTDYHGGLCLPVALPHATWVAVAPRDDGELHLHSTASEQPWVGADTDRAPGWAGYVTSALIEVGHQGGLDLLVDSTVPVGAGLSSSAALICAVATAVSQASPDELVTACIRAEVEGVGAPTGGMDQTVSLLARPGHALLLDFAEGSREQIAWCPEREGLELLVIDTRTRHSHAAGGYRARRAESEAALAADARTLDELGRRRRRHVITENGRVRATVAALSRNDWTEVGRLFTESHLSLRDDYEVSCPELDAVVESALSAGALGARMTGGGFGGCALVLSAAVRREEVLRAITAAFTARGWDAPRCLLAPASGPALRVGPATRPAPAR